MATRTSTTIAPTNAANAIAIWAAFVEDTFVTTGGWVRTSDTGQTNPAALTTPGAANTKAGYIILRMADSLQATKPCFIKLEFGSGAAANTPGLWITVGEGSDGAGTITNIRYDGGAASTPTIKSITSSAAVAVSYGSADTNRAQVYLFGVSGIYFLISIERSKDANGDDTSDGLICHFRADSSSSEFKQIYIIWGTTSQPSPELGCCYVLSGVNPTVFGSNSGVALAIPMKGYAQPSGIGVAICRDVEFAIHSAQTLTIYGASHTYRVTRVTPYLAVSGSSISDDALYMIRYE